MIINLVNDTKMWYLTVFRSVQKRQSRGEFATRLFPLRVCFVPNLQTGAGM